MLHLQELGRSSLKACNVHKNKGGREELPACKTKGAEAPVIAVETKRYP
jgi:hypothetical protein